MDINERIEASRLSGTLNISYMELEQLPELPDNLTTLLCHGNKLTEIQSLPRGLKKLVCCSNKLKSLSDLPTTLEYLMCNGNQLERLPALPKGMKRLLCHDNHLTSIPTLPESLELLGCSGNFIRSLQKPPQSLTELWAATNPWNSNFTWMWITKGNNSQKLHYYYEILEMKKIVRDASSVKNTFLRDSAILNEDVIHVLSSYLTGEFGTTANQVQQLHKKLALLDSKLYE
jgi:Leucine-rich repeat (LRR) protein